MMEFFSTYSFLFRGVIAASIAAVVAPAIGTYIVVRRYAAMADALSHVALVGTALGIVLGVSPVLMSIAVALVAAAMLERLRVGARLFGDAALALFMSGSLATAFVLLHFGPHARTDLPGLLFGSVSTVTPGDVWTIILLAVGVLGTLILFRREFFLVVLDPDLARAEGIPAARYTLLIALLAALTVAMTMRIVGALLMSGLMVVPVVAALQYQLGFTKTTVVAIAISFCATIVGLAVSFVFDLAPGATIILATLFFLIVSLVATRSR